MDADWSPPLPPLQQREDGEVRRVGVELEFIGLSVEKSAELVAEHSGGRIEERGRYERRIEGDDAGEWLVELDFAYLKEKGRDEFDEDDPMAVLDEAAEQLLRAGAELVVPVEVVSPPLPLPRLADVQSLIARLRDAGARGTDAGFAYAFGLQLNPEMPSLDADTVACYLKAFLCLREWLEQRSQVNATRKLTRYTADFPRSYVRKVIDPGYWPGTSQLIDDYLRENPTRNRALDMLPLFLHLDEKRLRAVVDDPRVKPRPALHYRLPNCEIDRKDWGIHIAWCDWLQVEHLAADRECLQRVCERYASVMDGLLKRFFVDWSSEVEQWLKSPAEL